MISEDRLIHEFMELVQIDSETRNERQIADVLKEKFSSLGLTAVEDDSQERTGHGAGNLFVTWPADSGVSAPKLLFTCHMDTVVPGQKIKPALGKTAGFEVMAAPFLERMTKRDWLPCSKQSGSFRSRSCRTARFSSSLRQAKSPG